MVARQQLGDIFLGITPRPVRDYMARAFAQARPKYDTLHIPCAGRFTVVLSAIAGGWEPERIVASDISLFSAVIGYAASGRDMAELGLSFHDELDGLNAHARTGRKAGGAVLYALKVCQLRQSTYYERIVRDELLANPGTYIDQLQRQIDEMARLMRGLTYQTRDVTDHCLAMASDPTAVIYCNPPGFAKGYTKMFDTGGRMTWASPQIPEFDAKTHRAELYRVLMEARALAYIYRSKAVEDGYHDRAVFAAQAPKRMDYVLCNRPEEAPLIVQALKETAIAPAKIPFMPDGYEIRPDARITFQEVTKGQALFYRDLFAHKLGVTKAERYFVALLDGYLMAVFGMFFSEVQRGQSGTVYEVFGFCAPCRRYPRINHLFMGALVTEDARQAFQAAIASAVTDVNRFQTTCISTTPEQKSHRSTGLKCILRETMPDGRYKLVYGGPFKRLSMSAWIADWMRKMRNIEKTNGKPMGIDMIPAGLEPADEG